MRWRRVILGLSLATIIPAVARAHGDGSAAGGLSDWIDELLLAGVVLAVLFLISVIVLTSRADAKAERDRRAPRDEENER